MARLSLTRGILAAFLLLLGLSAESATVVGSLQDSFATAYGGQVRTIQFDPLSTPQAIGTNTVWPVSVTRRITNGVFTVNLATNLGTFAYTNYYYNYLGDGAGITNIQGSNIVGLVSTGGITNGQDGVTLA